MIHTLLVILTTIVSTIFFSIAAITVSLFDSSGKMPHLVGAVWSRSILWASRVKVSVKNLSNIDPEETYIYMSNHQSNFDIPVLLAHLPVQFRWLAKAELYRIPVFGFAMKRAGYISIDRSDRRSAIQSLRRAAGIIRGGVSVMIFPEGTRSRDGNIQDFKKGGFILALDAGVPIVPVIIHGTWPIMQKKSWTIKPGHVVLEIGKPIQTSDYSRKTKDVLVARVHQEIRTSFEKGKTSV